MKKRPKRFGVMVGLFLSLPVVLCGSRRGGDDISATAAAAFRLLASMQVCGKEWWDEHKVAVKECSYRFTVDRIFKAVASIASGRVLIPSKSIFAAPGTSA